MSWSFAVLDAFFSGVFQGVCTVFKDVVARSGGDEFVNAGGAVEGQTVAASAGCRAQLPERTVHAADFVTAVAFSQTSQILDSPGAIGSLACNQAFRIVMTPVFKVEVNPVAVVISGVFMEHFLTHGVGLRIVDDVMARERFGLSRGVPRVKLPSLFRAILDVGNHAKCFWFPDFVMVLLVESHVSPSRRHLCVTVTSKRVKLFAEANVPPVVHAVVVNIFLAFYTHGLAFRARYLFGGFAVQKPFVVVVAHLRPFDVLFLSVLARKDRVGCEAHLRVQLRAPHGPSKFTSVDKLTNRVFVVRPVFVPMLPLLHLHVKIPAALVFRTGNRHDNGDWFALNARKR